MTNSKNMSDREETKGDLGSILRSAREEKGLNKQDLARCLHLDLSIISKIEDNRFGELAVPAFIHGYVRSISKELDIEPKMIVERLDSQLAKGNPRLSDFETRPPKQTTSDSSFVKYITRFLIIVLVILTANWWRSTSEKERGDNSIVVTQMDKGKQVSSPDENVKKIENFELYNFLDKKIGLNYSQKKDSQYRFKPIEQTPPQEIHENGIVRISSKSDTWVEIRDGTGLRSFYDLNNPHETVELIGNPPYRITIGNAETAEVHLDGSSVPFDKISEHGVASVKIGKRN